MLFTLLALICLPSLRYFGKLIFINRTHSMPIGLYKNLSSKKFEIGDIIVFYSTDKKSNLLKYIAGYDGDEYCFDFEGTIWVNGLPLAQQNNIKYYNKLSDESRCYVLKSNELLVLGEHPDSYDSRYFGPIKTKQVLAKVKLVFP